jgi:uncharacterized protein
VVLLFLVVVTGCAASEPSSPTSPTSPPEPTSSSQASEPSETAVPAVVPEGFERVQAVVADADGERCEICVWLADTAAQRSRGLMFVTDLGAADAMAFRYPEPRTGSFWMKDTILALSIAFFAPDGTYMTSFDMEPCITPSCPNYATPVDFLIAVEVPQGDLSDLGIGPGSTLAIGDVPCLAE